MEKREKVIIVCDKSSSFIAEPGISGSFWFKEQLKQKQFSA